jgi:hypothetical protein
MREMAYHSQLIILAYGGISSVVQSQESIERSVDAYDEIWRCTRIGPVTPSLPW